MSDRERLDDVLERLELLEADREIRTLLSRYSNYADSRRDEDWVGLWSRNGVLEVALGESSTVYREVQRWQGHDELRAFITNPEAHHRPGFYGRSLHVHGNNSIVRVDNGHAVATTYAVLLHLDAREVRLVGAGLCAWELTRHEGRWLIASCVRRRIGSQETADILRSAEA